MAAVLPALGARVKGDRLLINRGHRRAARQALELLLPAISQAERRFIITIAGESGSGKSEIAASLARQLARRGIGSLIIQQDDYFVYPPKTNEAMRRRDINHVGLSEVRLDRLDEDLKAARDGADSLVKPLVIFDDDTITTETLDLRGKKVIIVEGTYTTTLRHVDRRIFIARDYNDTRRTRLRRAREAQDEFLEQVLQIEHGLIAPHRARADIIITRDYQAQPNPEKTA